MTYSFEPPLERFAWLLGAAAAPLYQPGDLHQAAAFALRNWQVIGPVSKRLLAWIPSQENDTAPVQQLRDRVTSISVLARIQNSLCSRLVGALHEARIPYALLKGTALRLGFYDRPEHRAGFDIDIAVAGEHLRMAESIAIDLGFLPAQWDQAAKRFRSADLRLRSLVEASHYELGFLARCNVPTGLTEATGATILRDLDRAPAWFLTDSGRPACWVTVDIHHRLSHEIGLEQAWHSRRTVNRHGVQAQILGTPWLLLHTVFKLYWEGVHNYGKGAYQYCDIVRLLPQMSADEIEQLCRLLTQYRLEVCAYYVFRRLEPHFGVVLPEPLRSWIGELAVPRSGADARSLNDLGDMWPKILGGR